MTATQVHAPTRPRRRWPRRLGVLLLFFIGLPTGYYFYARWSLERDLAEALAETDRLDPRWRLADIEADRKSYRDDENSALHVIKLTRMVGRNNPTWHRDYQRVFEDLPPQAQLNIQQLELLREAFEKIPEVRDGARKLKDMPGGRFPIAYSADWISTNMSNQQDARRVFGVLEADAMLRAHQGDTDGALDSSMALLNAARAFGDEPTLISLLIRSTALHVMMAAVERTLAQGQAGETSLRELQNRLGRERRDLHAHWISAMRGDRAGHHEAFLAMSQGKLRLSALAVGRQSWTLWDRAVDAVPMLSTRDYPGHLRYMNELVAATELPLHQQSEAMSAWRKVEHRSRPFTAVVGLAPPMVGDVHLRGQAWLAATQVGVSCERFRLARQRWPASLQDVLDAKLLDAVPADPFDGQPLRFARWKEGVTIYSVGHDREDNGGNIDKARHQAQGVDLGLRLWDPERRRQPPRPVVEVPQ